ncbi:MAG: TfuA-related McrA-glycine thioamidation protein [Candidatus Methanofastidiosia archaeon]
MISVFLGPSLELENARKILEAHYLPPVKRGDVEEQVYEGAKRICIVDGVFFHDSSVGHREIISAIEAGVKVYGAASMGALRASELDTYGMIGVGKIYEMYKNGELDSDDEVALAYEPSTFYTISEPLVNIRETFRLAHEGRVISSDIQRELIEIASSLYFPKRTYSKIFEIAKEKYTLDIKALTDFVSREKINLKREDTVLLLNKMRDSCF